MPPKREKREDAEYVPSDDDDGEEIEEVEAEPTKPSKKSTKAKKSKRKDTDEYQPSDSEDVESEEEYIETGQSSQGGRKTEKKTTEEQTPDDDDNDDDKGKVKEKEEEIKSSKEKVQITETEGEISESPDYDESLKSYPLPSFSRPQVFNKNIALIGSINIQAFGTKKASNTVIMRIITDILRHYDIILCQEIRANDEIIQDLTSEVSTPATPYAYVTSRPIGRTRYQERYVFLYRKNEWKVLEDYVIDDDDGLGDKFIREPYVVRFQNLKKPKIRIVLVGCHTQPENAFEEIKTLVDTVYPDVRRKLQRDNVQEKRQLDRGIRPKEKNKFHTFLSYLRYYCCCGCFGFCGRSYSNVPTRDFPEDLITSGVDTNEPIIMMGDFNAAGSYVNKTKRTELDALLKKHDLIWGIKDNVDTTVADGPDTAYDRFIFEAANERKWIGNARAWRFDEGWLKGDADVNAVKKAAKRVTDHYPIEFELKLS